ncbi:restriction endonuclease [Terrabacter sp. GCM10028922]|uniref:restriction endonuclease n=1 Tax=Terrabacter sp. GCM10028922 TaxID=3273428 RepID=UPI00361EBA64
MTVPSYEQMMRPTLEVLADKGPLAFRSLVDLVAQRMQIGEDDMVATIDSGQSVVVNRVGWAVTYLVQAGVIKRPRRAYAEVTERGRQLLDSVQGPISNSDLEQFEEFRDFRQRSRRKPKPAPGDNPAALHDIEDEGADADTPQEVISQMVATVHGALAGELLERVMDLTPIAFEQLVLRLLGAMGYGASGQIESTAESGDAGIDGVISQDPLGLDRIYVQAKRYSRDRTIGRPAMQAFVGALQGQQADRGVFIATCAFTKDALTYADRVGVRIIPIDGIRLAELMLKHRVGVQPGYVTTLLRLDEDFFETL